MSWVLGGLATFVLVTYGWMLFRLQDDALIASYTRLLFALGPQGAGDASAYWSEALSMARTVGVAALFVWAAHWLQHRADRYGEQIEDLGLHPALLGVACGLLAVLTIVFGTLAERSPFIYFQF